MGMCKGCNEVFSSIYMKDEYCEQCYERLTNDKQIIECLKCKTINRISSNFCKFCGEKLEKNVEAYTPIKEKEVKTVNNVISNKEADQTISKLHPDKKTLDKNSKFSDEKENNDSNADELLKWAELLEKGFIDKEDFEKKKKELI